MGRGKTNKTSKKEEIIKEEKTEEELKEEFFEGEKIKDSIFKKIINILLWLILFAWIAVCLIDFYKTHQGEKPMFTFKKEVTKYDDGEVEIYTGAGYKVFKYKRKCFDGIEFGPFWTKDASVENKNCKK